MATSKEQAKQAFSAKNPGIAGLTFRNFEGKEDFEHMASITNASNAADKVKETASAKNLEHYFEHKKDVDPYQDVVFAEVDGMPVAFGSVFWMDEHEGPRVYMHSGHVLPEWRNRDLGQAVFQWSENRLRDLAASHPEEKEKFLHGWACDTEKWRKKMYEDRGYGKIRYFYLMLRELSQTIPESNMPKGLEVRPSEKSHFRQIFDASNEAFRDHWGHVEQNDEDFERWSKHPLRDESLWKVAWDGNEVAGMVLNMINPEENEKLGVKWGWTDPISVRRPWRRRGLATALIIESLHLLKARGMSHAALGVDTQNPSGALKLYESVGFKVDESWTDYRRKLD